MATYEFFGTLRIDADTEEQAIKIYETKLAGLDTNLEEVYEVK